MTRADAQPGLEMPNFGDVWRRRTKCRGKSSPNPLPLVNLARRAIRFWPLLVVVVLTDCATKRLAEERLVPGVPRDVIGETVRLTLAYNRGAVFGIPLGSASRIVLIAVSVAVLVLLLRTYSHTPASDRWRLVALSLLCAGALGNLFDRLMSARGVVDFIDIGLGSVRFWTFNVADMGVTFGAIMLALSLWREEQREYPPRESASRH
jgi:signal peptidase II